MNFTEVAMCAAITVSISGASYAALNSDLLTERTRAVADRADCRAVETAIVGYLARNGQAPTRMTDLQPYVRGDISRFTIRAGRAAGPGCAA